MQQFPDGLARDKVVALLTAAGWDARQVAALFAVTAFRHQPSDAAGVGALASRLATAGRGPDAVLFFLRVAPAASAEALTALLVDAPVVFVAEAARHGVPVRDLPWLWAAARRLGLPEDGRDAAGWVAAALLRATHSPPGEPEFAAVAAAIGPWLTQFGPGGWRWLLLGPRTVAQARAESAGWGQDTQNLDFLLALSGALDGTALVAPPDLGWPRLP